MLSSVSESKKLSNIHDIPVEDIQLISLNASCLNSDVPYKRVRFKMDLSSKPGNLMYFGVPNLRYETPFYLSKDSLKLRGETIGKVKDMENDTCDTSYFRRNDTALTINPNSRSLCSGCVPCATHRQDATDHCPVDSERKLDAYLKELFKNPSKNAQTRPHFGRPSITKEGYDFSNLYQVAIVTGCYKDEGSAINNIETISNYFNKNGFEGEIKYIGSEIETEEGIKELAKKVPNMNLCLSWECFDRRKQLLKNSKSRITAEKAQKILETASKHNISTNFTYIVGLDSLQEMKNGLEKFSPFVKKLPIFQVFQPHFEEQKSVRNEEANKIEYYLKARKIIEETFKENGSKPNPWENYRSLWYFSFDGETLDGIRI